VSHKKIFPVGRMELGNYCVKTINDDKFQFETLRGVCKKAIIETDKDKLKEASKELSALLEFKTKQLHRELELLSKACSLINGLVAIYNDA
jgi:hypothetical protein